jgi:hypothetical protein
MKYLSASCTCLLVLAGIVLSLWVCGCGARRTAMTQPPGGKGWQAYHQSYHFHSVVSSTQQQGNYQVTRTQSNSKHKLLEGSFVRSKEVPSCTGIPWLKDCKALVNKQGGNQ